MPYSHTVRWDLFFEDLEGQLASEWEAERAALDTEAERLRLSRVDLRARLVALVAEAAVPARDARAPAFDLIDGTVVSASIAAIGADWCGLTTGGARPGMTIVPLAAIEAVTLSHGVMLRSARPAPVAPALGERMTLGFVLRDVTRRRVSVAIGLVSGRTLTGTIDRAGADHLDLALHEPGAVRRASDVSGYRLVAFAAIAWVRLEQPVAVTLP